MNQIIGLEWIPEDTSTHEDTEYPMFMAYYKCHDVDWNLSESTAAYQTEDGDVHISILNKVKILVPELALIPDPELHSGGLKAVFGKHDVTTHLNKESLHIGVGIKLGDISPQSILDATNDADQIAATCAIALSQAFGVRKVAAYTAMITKDGGKRPTSFVYSLRAPGPAVFDPQAKDELAIGLSNLGSSKSGAVEAAISRYESSKNMTVEADRLLTLWTAIERLAPGVKSKMANWMLETEQASCETIKDSHDHRSLNFEFYRKLRNRIVHQGLTTIDPPWEGQGLLVNRAQLLDAYCSEGIRIALGMSPTGEVHRQLNIASENPLASEQLEN